MASEPRKIQAIELGCKLPKELEARDGARIRELAEALGRSESTIHTSLSTLKEEGYVEKDGHTPGSQTPTRRMGTGPNSS